MLTFLANLIIRSDAPNFPTKFVERTWQFDITEPYARVALNADKTVRLDAAGEPLWVLVQPIEQTIEQPIPSAVPTADSDIVYRLLHRDYRCSSHELAEAAGEIKRLRRALAQKGGAA